MKIGINTSTLESDGYDRYGDQVYQKLKEQGYDAADVSLAQTGHRVYKVTQKEAEEILLRERKLADEAGILISQVHGPWRWPARDASEEDRAERLSSMKRSIHFTSLLGCKHWVVHPIMPFGWEGHTEQEEAELWRINADFFSRLAAVGEKYGVTVCLENMPFPDFPISSAIDIMKLVKMVDHPYFKVCLDTGHANVVAPKPAEAVKIIGKDYLKILHVHGNDGTQDSHLNPGHPSDTTDWASFTAALKEIGFDGVVNLETFPKPQGQDGKAPEHIEINLANMAKKIAGVE